MSRKLIDLTGMKFGRLTALKRATLGKNYKYLCECECGSLVEIRVPDLRTGQTQSCGCLKREVSIKKSTKHGDHGSPEYRSWQAMIKRCNSKTNKNYKEYGERGITVCDRWLENYSNFLEDMGRRPHLNYSLDRIDNNGNYEKKNCRWTNKVEQARNRRVRKDNKYGVTGISFNKELKKYSSGISINKEWILLGFFISLNDAISARKEAELKYWGKSS